MKKHISKIMLGIAILFLAGVVLNIFGAITNNTFWRETEQLMLIAFIALFGLFLGVYRIIDLLESQHKE